MKKAIFCIAVLTALYTSSCKKGDSTAAPTRKDSLTNGKWLTTAATVRTNILGTDTTFDVFSTTLPCERDNLTIFKSNDSLVDDEGVLKCSASSPQQTTQGTWKLSSDNKQLSLYTGGQALDGAFQITSFSNTSMRLERDSSISGFTGHLVVVYQHQN